MVSSFRRGRVQIIKKGSGGRLKEVGNSCTTGVCLNNAVLTEFNTWKKAGKPITPLFTGHSATVLSPQADLEKISGRLSNNFGLNSAKPQICGRRRLNKNPAD